MAAARAGRRAEIAETGTYDAHEEELTVGARLAWRHNTRCIGKLYWRGLTVRDFRDVTDAAGDRRRAAWTTRSSCTTRAGSSPRSPIFAPDRPGQQAAIVRNSQLISYAGHRQADGTIVGDPNTAALTDVAKANGWSPAHEGPLRRPAAGRRDAATARSRVHEIPRGLAHEVEIEHPTIPGLAELGLRWWGFPSICDNVLSIGGINYPLAPFTGWYLAPEISARDFSDTYRYNLLPEIAEALGIDTSDVRSLWKDRAVVELTAAVLHSYDKAGIRMDDHHTAAQKFHKWTKSEEKKGCPVEAEWSWMIPPISGSLLAELPRGVRGRLRAAGADPPAPRQLAAGSSLRARRRRFGLRPPAASTSSSSDVLERLAQLLEIGHRVVVAEQAEVHPAVVGHDRDGQRLVLGQERDREQVLELAPEHVERELRPGHVRHEQVEQPRRELQPRRLGEDRRRRQRLQAGDDLGARRPAWSP